MREGLKDFLTLKRSTSLIVTCFVKGKEEERVLKQFSFFLSFFLFHVKTPPESKDEDEKG